ncbi:MAG: glycine cleavage system protein GcvH [Proteobacteria bacterium]|nr:glycine cleavage system protein GcvH [Pseudomonadota bacterium]
MPNPSDRRYTKDHEWARRDEGRVTIGVTAFAVEQLGDITLVELPAVGDLVRAGQPFGTIESVKSVSELYAPLSGRVAAINPRLEDEPELVNSAPFGEGWMIALEPSGAEFEQLLDAAAYTALLAAAQTAH